MHLAAGMDGIRYITDDMGVYRKIEDGSPRLFFALQSYRISTEHAVDACERDGEEETSKSQDEAPPVWETKSFLALNGDEIFDHRVDHVLYEYVHNGDVLKPGRRFNETEGDINVLRRSALEVARHLVHNYMCLWDLIDGYSCFEQRKPKRKHSREGTTLARQIVLKSYFDIASEKLCVCAWNSTISLSPMVVVQRILRYWLQCLRLVDHPKHPSWLHVQLRADRARQLYNIDDSAEWSCQLAEVCLHSVICTWRRDIAAIQDKMLHRALCKKIAKLARGTLRAYALKLLPLCCILKEFLSFKTAAFEGWREQCGATKYFHRMNLWLR